MMLTVDPLGLSQMVDLVRLAIPVILAAGALFLGAWFVINRA